MPRVDDRSDSQEWQLGKGDRILGPEWGPGRRDRSCSQEGLPGIGYWSLSQERGPGPRDRVLAKKGSQELETGF